MVAAYSTQYRRTRETAEAVARPLGMQVSVRAVDASNAAAYADDLAAEILSGHMGGTVLVVGHSNTVPALVAAFGGREVGEISETEYDRLYLIVVDRPGVARTFAASYGRQTD